MTQIEEQFAESLFDRYPTSRGKVRIRFPVFTGRSGSSVWHIEIDPTKDHRGGAAFAKVDAWTRCQKERDRHAIAREHPRMREYIPEIIFPVATRQAIVEGERTFVIYQPAHNMVRTLALSDVLRGTRYSVRDEAQVVKHLINPVLNSWYESLSNIAETQAFDLAAEYARLFDLGEEDLEPDQRRSAGLAARMKENFGIEGMPQKIIFDTPHPQTETISLPNPAYFLSHLADVSRSQRTLNLPMLPMHGDLHTGNIICRLSERGSLDIDAPPVLIDFAQYEEEGFPFFDLAYLELSILTDVMPANTLDEWQDWQTLLTFITAAVYPEGEPEGRRPDEAWQLITPLREAVAKMIADAAARGPGIGERFEAAWWFAVAVAGLRFARRSTAFGAQGGVGLFYAGQAVKHLQTLLQIAPASNETRALLDWGEGTGFFVQGLSAPAAKASTAVRPSSIPQPPDLYIAHTYTPTVFIGRQDELNELKTWAQSADPMMVVEAIGGQGKSALTWHWVHNHAARDIPHFAGAMWWSFYESDGAMDNFIAHALAYVTDTPLDEIKKKSREDRERALIAALKERPFLLVMDGLERILHAYYTVKASHLTDEEIERVRERGEAVDRLCVNKLDGRFLETLLSIHPTKILVSTRLLPAHLETRANTLVNGVQRKLLNGLSANDALDLMRHYGIKGNGEKIKDFTWHFGNHGLLLGIIAGQINDYARASGNFEAWYAARGKKLTLHDLDIRQRQTHILEFALHNLPDDAAKLLEQLAVFRYPISYDILSYINPFTELHYVSPFSPEQEAEYQAKQTEYENVQIQWSKAPAGLEEEARFGQALSEISKILNAFADRKQQAYDRARRVAEPDLDKALHMLEDRGLILSDVRADIYDLHPVVRAYTYERLNPDRRTEMLEGKKTVFDSQAQTDMSQVTEVPQLRRELEIYHALIASQQWDLAWNFYSRFLKEVLQYQLNAYYEIVELLSPLFEEDNKPPRLSNPNVQRACINWYANALTHDEEKKRNVRAMAVQIAIELKDVHNLGVELYNFSVIFSHNNQLYSALWAIELVLKMSYVGEGRGMDLANACYSLISTHSTKIGQWEQSKEAYQLFNRDHKQIYGYVLQCKIELEYLYLLIVNELKDEVITQLQRVEQIAYSTRYALAIREIERCKGEISLLNADGTKADLFFQEYERLCHKVRISVTAALGGQARSLILQERYNSARLLVENGIDNPSAAEVWLALGEKQKAKEAAISAYREAWGEGQPYVDWWPLQRATKVLQALGEPLPDMPAFDPEKRERLPYEDEIIAFIEKLEAEKEAAEAIDEAEEFVQEVDDLDRQEDDKADDADEDDTATRGPSDIVFPRSAAPQPVRERWAVLVGVNQYIDPNLGSLKYCANDVQLLGQVLEQAQFTSLVLHDQDQREEAKRPLAENVRHALEMLRQRAHADDLLWLHFSCHGEVINGEPVLIFANTRQRTEPYILRVREIETMFRDFKRVLVTLDACHVGVEGGRGSDDLEFIQHVNEMAENFAVLAASTSQQRAAEWQDQKMGVFSYYLWDGIQGRADRSGRGYITVTDLASHVLNGVRRWSFRQGGILQDPTYSIRGIGDMIVVDRRKRI